MLHEAMITRPDLSPPLPPYIWRRKTTEGPPSPPFVRIQHTFVCVLSLTDPVNCPPDGVKLTEIDVQGSAGLRLPRALSMTAKSARLPPLSRYRGSRYRERRTRDNDATKWSKRVPSESIQCPLDFSSPGGFPLWMVGYARILGPASLARGRNARGGFILDLFCWVWWNNFGIFIQDGGFLKW